jgi:hypothetical protein
VLVTLITLITTQIGVVPFAPPPNNAPDAFRRIHSPRYEPESPGATRLTEMSTV